MLRLDIYTRGNKPMAVLVDKEKEIVIEPNEIPWLIRSLQAARELLDANKKELS